MPLLAGKKNIGHNIKVEEEAGKPQKQAVAIALSKARGKDFSEPGEAPAVHDIMREAHVSMQTAQNALRNTPASKPMRVRMEMAIEFLENHVEDSLPLPVAVNGSAEGKDIESTSQKKLRLAHRMLADSEDELDAARRRGEPASIIRDLIDEVKDAQRYLRACKSSAKDADPTPIPIEGEDRVLGRGAAARAYGKDAGEEEQPAHVLMREGGKLEVAGKFAAALAKYRKAAVIFAKTGDSVGKKDAYQAVEEMERKVKHAKDRVLGRGAVGDDLMGRREEENLNKALRKNPKGIEAYGVKGFKNTQWRKVFKSAEAMEKWCEQNDAEVQGTRDVAQDSLRPVPVDDETKYAERPRSARVITSVAAPTREDVERIYAKKDPEGFKRAFGKDGDQMNDSINSWVTKSGWAKGVVTYELSSQEGYPGRVNDYTALPEHWKNGKKFETEEPRSYGGTTQWFSTLDAAKKAVEKAVEKSEVYRKAYKAKKGTKDSIKQMARDSFYGRNIARGPGEMSRANDAARRAYDGDFKPGDKVTTDVTPQIGTILKIEGSGDKTTALIKFGEPDKYGVADVRKLYTYLLRKSAKDEHEGFKKLEGKLSHEAGVNDPAALAASIGRKKYGAAGMAKKSAAARDTFGGTWSSDGQNPGGEVYKISRLKTWGHVVESAHAPGQFIGAIYLDRKEMGSKFFTSKAAAKKWVENEAGYVQQREINAKAKDSLRPVTV